MELHYKTSFEKNRYSYLFTSGHQCYNEKDCLEETHTYRENNIELFSPQKKLLFGYLNELFSGKQQLILTKFSPDVLEKLTDPFYPSWEYLFFSNDYSGTAVDKGFIENRKKNIIAGKINSLNPDFSIEKSCQMKILFLSIK
jgi:hypothetical protein